MGVEFYEFPKEMLQLVNLRYLPSTCRSPLPSSISNLRNLQAIIFRQISSLLPIQEAEEIFDIPCWRHIKFQETYLSSNRKSCVLQEHLQTLSGIEASDLPRIIESVPNVKKIGLFCFYGASSNIDLACLHKLETLKCSCKFSSDGHSVLSFLIFPPSLKKLTLHKCEIPLGYMSKIGTFPNLEVLKLRNTPLENLSTWEPTEGESSRLQFLLLEKLNLVNWEADETHFPRLERLVIRDCLKLKEIPSGIGEISTLEIIEVHKSRPSAVASARKIQEEQLELGNCGLQVLIS